MMIKRYFAVMLLTLIILSPFCVEAEEGFSLPHKELIFPVGDLTSPHAPCIVELPDGELFAVWYALGPEGPVSAIWGSRKSRDAKEWSKPSLVNYSPGRSNKNPVLYFDKERGTLLLFWAEERRWHKWKRDMLRFKISKDLGRTWDDARDVSNKFRGFLSRNHPLKLDDGRLLLPIYTDWNTSSAVIISKDGGLTWDGPRYILYLFGTQPTIIQRSDKNLFTLMRTGMPPRLAWQAVSRNDGYDWTEQRTSRVDNPGASLEMVKLKNGHIALAFNDSKTTRSEISLAISSDDGKTWSRGRMIDCRPQNSNCYPSIIQTEDGLIHVVYVYDGRSGIAHFVTNEEWIRGDI